MAQRQFRSDDTSMWNERFGASVDGAGSAGSNVQTSFSASISSTSATAGSGTGFSAGNLILIHQSRNGGTGVGNWELNKISSVGGGTNWTLAYATIYAYDTTAQVYLMKQYSSYNGSLAVGTAWNGSSGGIGGFFCDGSATITGGTSSGTGFRGGSSGTPGPNKGQLQGEGTAGAGAVSTAANGNAGGGGTSDSGNQTGGGGGGANAAAGTNGQSNNGQGGTGGGLVANASLVIADFGGGGGSGGATASSSNIGGSGGGFILVIAKNIVFSGAFAVNGNNGANGDPDDAGGGGGAGGSILLKAQTIDFGSSQVTATGGIGGDGSGGGGGGGVDGGAGSVGRIHADYLTSINGTTNPAYDASIDAIFANIMSPDDGYAFLM